MKKIDRALYVLIGITFLVGLAGHVWPSSRILFLTLTPFFLLGINIFLLFTGLELRDKRIFLAVFLLILITLILEIIGVKTGMVFGSYIYSSVLGLSVGDVPVVIGLNWVGLILGATVVASSFKALKSRNIQFQAATAAGLMVLLDIFLEQVAIKLNYWQWAGGMPPLQNYLAWWLISFAGSLLTLKFIKFKKPAIPAFVFLVQLIYFLLLNLFI